MTIQLTRDTLILIAALIFLVIAILLAVIFPGQSSAPTASTATSLAAASTAQPSAVRQPTESLLGADGAQPTADVAAVPTSDLGLDGDYPAPQETDDVPSSDVTPTGSAEQQLIETAAASPIAPFVPSRPTQPSGGIPSGFSAQGTAYPQPATPTPNEGEDPLDATATPTQQTNAGSGGPTVAAPPPATPTSPPPQPQAQATNRPVGAAPTVPPRPRPRPTDKPTAPPLDVLRGNVRWTAAQGPIVVRRDLLLVSGATLVVEPGVEVQLAPGASFFVEGTLYAIGSADRPVRFVGVNSQRWEGIFGRPGSNIAMEYAEIRGGGNGGTVLLSEGGNLVLHHARVAENGGHLQVSDSRLEMRDSEIAGNDMPYGSALEANYTSGNGVILTNNRIGGNRQQPGTSPVRISSASTFDTLNLDLQGNLLVGIEGPDLALSTNGPLQGVLACNTLVGGPDGLSLRSDMPQVPGFALSIHDNVIEKHTPPIIPIYLKYGIGRGATSELALDMRNNWWGSPLGPYEPDRNAEGRGEAVGDTVAFSPWLNKRPACAPQQ